MIYNLARIASMLSCYTVLAAAPLALGTWIMVQRTGGILSGLWLSFLLVLLLGSLALGAFGLYALGTGSAGSVLST